MKIAVYLSLLISANLVSPLNIPQKMDEAEDKELYLPDDRKSVTKPADVEGVYNEGFVRDEDQTADDQPAQYATEDEKETLAAAGSAKMDTRFGVVVIISYIGVSITSAGISPVHDLKVKINSKIINEQFLLKTPQESVKHLDNAILKATKNVTQNQQMEETLNQISKDLVAAILSKLEIQDKITRITREALEAPGKNKGITAIETRRILDYISRTMSGNILSFTRASTETELHRLVYGLGQIAAEVSIIAALKDITYPTALSKKQSIDLTLRRKRDVTINSKIISAVTMHTPLAKESTTVYDAVLNKSTSHKSLSTNNSKGTSEVLLSPFSVYSDVKKPVQVVGTKTVQPAATRGFLNQTVLDMENAETGSNLTDTIVISKPINISNYEAVVSRALDDRDSNTQLLADDWIDKPPLNADVVAEMEIDRPDVDEDTENNNKKAKQKMERLELKAKKAILYAGDVAYLTAASVVAMRRALTASIEVMMSVKYAKNGMANHQELMMNLAKTAAQQAGKEAKSATSKSLACERVVKLALKYTAQSYGAKLNHIANRIVMDTVPLANLAKSMAYVSSDIAINSLYQATDVKPPA